MGHDIPHAIDSDIYLSAMISHRVGNEIQHALRRLDRKRLTFHSMSTQFKIRRITSNLEARINNHER